MTVKWIDDGLNVYYHSRSCPVTGWMCAAAGCRKGCQMAEEKKPEMVDHPAHYGGADDPYEHIKVAEAWGLGYCLGNATKYIARAGKKGDRLEDLEKAAWYLAREIENERLARVGKAAILEVFNNKVNFGYMHECRLPEGTPEDGGHHAGQACDECGGHGWVLRDGAGMRCECRLTSADVHRGVCRVCRVETLVNADDRCLRCYSGPDPHARTVEDAGEPAQAPAASTVAAPAAEAPRDALEVARGELGDVMARYLSELVKRKKIVGT